MLTPQQQKWVDALRSGKYKQGRTWLHTTAGQFCCLGVACDLFAKELKLPTAIKGDRIYYHGYSSALPEQVVYYLGLNGPHGFCTGKASLAKLNDDGVPFTEIADRIESGDYFVRQPELQD